MFPRLPRVLRARITTDVALPAPLVGMPSSQVQPLAQGPPSLVKGSRASGSADEALVIALAVLTYDKRCGGEDEYVHSLEVEPIPPFSKCAILLVFVAQSTSHRCKSYVGF